MQVDYSSYQSIKRWYEKEAGTYQFNTDKFQLLHEYMMISVFEISLNDMEKDFGKPPCDYSWFVTGSAGRSEQTMLSDQDHGLVFNEKNEDAQNYFRRLGERLTMGLQYVGYPLCEGNVMSSNPLWCKFIGDWQLQLEHWMENNTWQSLRYLLIFIDARVLAGNDKNILSLKQLIYQMISRQPFLLSRLFENTERRVNVLGLFNQFLTVNSGSYTDCINLKQVAIFPYVNTIRLLSIYKKVKETSTLSRMESLSAKSPYEKIPVFHEENFKKLLQFQLEHCIEQDNQYLNVRNLSYIEKCELKQILKDIKKLQKYTEQIVQRAVFHER